jgi:hypothetical protein
LEAARLGASPWPNVLAAKVAPQLPAAPDQEVNADGTVIIDTASSNMVGVWDVTNTNESSALMIYALTPSASRPSRARTTGARITTEFTF